MKNKHRCIDAVMTLICDGALYGKKGNRIKLDLFREAKNSMFKNNIEFSPEAAVDTWNKNANELLNRVRGLTKKRIKLINRLAIKYTLADFKAAIDKINANKWALGISTSHNKSYRGWRFRFDYLIREDIFLRVMEGWLEAPEVLDDIDRRDKFKR